MGEGVNRIEYVMGVLCSVKKEKFADGYHDVYTFTVDGWNECAVTSLRSAERVIRGRLDSSVRNTLGIDKKGGEG